MAQQGMTPQQQQQLQKQQQMQQRQISMSQGMANGPPDPNATAEMEDDLSSEDSLDINPSDLQSLGKTSVGEMGANPQQQAIRNSMGQPTMTQNSMGRMSPSLKAQGPARQGSTPPGSIPPGSIPPGSMPPGSIPPGSIPPGSMPPGSMPPGSMGKGQISRGESMGRVQRGSQRSMGQGSMNKGAMKQGSLAHGPGGPSAMNRGPMAQGKPGQGSMVAQAPSVGQGQLIQGQQSQRQMISRQMVQGAMSSQTMGMNPEGSPGINPTAADIQAMEAMQMYWQSMYPSGDFPNFMNMMVPQASMPPVPFLYMVCPPTPGGGACPSSMFYYNSGGSAATGNVADVRQEFAYETGDVGLALDENMSGGRVQDNGGRDSREGPCNCDPLSEAESRESQEDHCNCNLERDRHLQDVLGSQIMGLRENYDCELNSSFDSRPDSERGMGVGPRMLSGSSLDVERCVDKCMPRASYFCHTGAVGEGHVECHPGPCPPPGLALCGKCGFQGMTARLGAGGSGVAQQQQIQQQQTQQEQQLSQQTQQLSQQTQQLSQQTQQQQHVRVAGAGRGVRTTAGGGGRSPMAAAQQHYKKTGNRGRRGMSPTRGGGGGGGGGTVCTRPMCTTNCPNRSPADRMTRSPGQRMASQRICAKTVQHMGDQGATISRYPPSHLQQSLSQIRVPPVRPVSEAKDTESMRLRLGDLSPGEDIVYHLHCKATDDSLRRPFVTKVIPCDDPLAYALNDAAREVAEYRCRMADMELTSKDPLTPLTSSLSEIPMASPGGQGAPGVFSAMATSSDTCCINCCPNSDEMCNMIRSVGMTGANMAPLLGRQRGGGGEEGVKVSATAAALTKAGGGRGGTMRVGDTSTAHDAMGITSSCPARVTAAHLHLAGTERRVVAAPGVTSDAASGAGGAARSGGGRKAGSRRPTPQSSTRDCPACRCRKTKGPAPPTAPSAGPGGAASQLRTAPPKRECCICTEGEKAPQPPQLDYTEVLGGGRRGATEDAAANAMGRYLLTPDKMLDKQMNTEGDVEWRRRRATPDAAADAMVTLLHSRVPSLITMESEKELRDKQPGGGGGGGGGAWARRACEEKLDVAMECVAACCPCVDVVASGVRCVCDTPDKCCMCERRAPSESQDSENAAVGGATNVEVAPEEGGASALHSQQQQQQKQHKLPRQKILPL